MTIGIIGAGFGLYGYLPAVLQSEKKVFLIERAKKKFSDRTELQQFANRIIWVADADELIENVETLIISTRPDVQKALVFQAAAKENIKNFILEKPLASNVQDAAAVINLLEKCGKNFRINYSFFYSDWFESLKRIFSDEHRSDDLELNITWNFKAHHYANNLSNWKRFSNQGGGVINFFGIHLIAAICRLNFTEIISSEAEGFSENDIFCFSAIVKDEKTNLCRIQVNADSEINLFRIVLKNNSTTEESILFESESPFEKTSKNNLFDDLDIRVPLLCQIINEIKKPDENNLFSLYQAINKLWSQVEKQSATAFSTKK